MRAALAPRAARPRVDVDQIKLPAFALADDLLPAPGGWHTHRFHQLLYAAEGALRLETEEGTWLLPPQRAAWISAGVCHRVEALQPAELRTVYLGKRAIAPPDFGCRVFPATPLAREMILGAMRWDERRSPGDPLARSFFAALAGLALEWAARPGPYLLPTAHSDELRRATKWVKRNLDRDPTVSQAARAAGTSERTLNRRFADELRMTFRGYLRAARLLRAMELLVMPGARITEVALAVGFSSPSAFTAAFTAFHGEPPRAYRLVASP